MKIACWNVNSLRSRITHLEKLITEENPDVILLQELKCEETQFPHLELDHFGYNYHIVGQKTYNGVAVLSKYPIEEQISSLPSYNIDDDIQARYAESVLTINSEIWRIISVYVPNGSEIGSEKFHYKLKFLERLYKHLKNLQNLEENLVIGGDFNIANLDLDIYDPKKLANSLCCSLTEKKALRKILGLDLFDNYRILHPNQSKFSWWDYRGGSFNHNKGLRIDYILSNAQATNKLKTMSMLETYRALEKPSDHIPIISEYS